MITREIAFKLTMKMVDLLGTTKEKNEETLTVSIDNDGFRYIHTSDYNDATRECINKWQCINLNTDETEYISDDYVVSLLTEEDSDKIGERVFHYLTMEG